MNKKIKNVGRLEASSTYKFGSIGTALMLVFMVIAFSAFTQIAKKGNISEVCFEFVGTDMPNDIDATTSINYLEGAPSIICPGENKTLCGICFDDTYFLLDEDGKPDFENNPALKSIVEANWDNEGIHDSPIPVPGTGPGAGQQYVTLKFRAIKVNE